MSSLEAFFTVVVVLAASLVGTYWLICRLRDGVSTRDRLIREAHQRADAAREIDELLLTLPADDPAWNAGLERLWDAARDNHEGGNP